MEDLSMLQKQEKVPERCKYWPACKNGDECVYHHPTLPCKWVVQSSSAWHAALCATHLSDMSWLAPRRLGPDCPESDTVQLFTAWREGLQKGKLSASVWVNSWCTTPCALLGKEPRPAPALCTSGFLWYSGFCVQQMLEDFAPFDSISFPSEFSLTANLLINACSSIQTVNTMRSALSQTVLTLMPVDEPPIHLLNQVSISYFMGFKLKCWRDNSIFGNRNWQWWRFFFFFARVDLILLQLLMQDEE